MFADDDALSTEPASQTAMAEYFDDGHHTEVTVSCTIVLINMSFFTFVSGTKVVAINLINNSLNIVCARVYHCIPLFVYCFFCTHVKELGPKKKTGPKRPLLNGLT